RLLHARHGHQIGRQWRDGRITFLMAHVPSKTRKKVEWLLRRAEGALLPERLLADEGEHLEPAQARTKLLEHADDVTLVGADARAASLARAIDAPGGDERRTYIEQHGVAGVRQFRAGSGTRVYALEVETFPHHVNNVYLLLEQRSAILFDCGSGSATSQ